MHYRLQISGRYSICLFTITNLDGGPDVDEPGAAEVRDPVHGERHHEQLLGTVALRMVG